MAADKNPTPQERTGNSCQPRKIYSIIGKKLQAYTTDKGEREHDTSNQS